MKTLSTLSIAFLLIFVSFSEIFSQITIEYEDVPFVLDETYHFYAIGAPNISAPESGEDQTWDFSELIYQVESNTKFSPAENAEFPSDSRYNISITNFGVIDLYSEYYYQKQDDGIKRIGSRMLPVDIALTEFTGNPSDSINFVESINKHEMNDMPLPLNYGATWTDEVTYKTNFNLSISMLGLDHVASYNSQHVTYNCEVISSGTMIIPDEAGTPVSIEGLLIKRDIAVVDSFYIDDMPASSMILSAFGLEQGAMSTQSAYEFYTQGYSHQVARFIMSSNWSQVLEFQYAKLTASDVEEIGSLNCNIYPNPTKDFIRINQVNQSIERNISIYDLSGNKMDCREISDGVFDLRGLPSGAYIVILNNNGSVDREIIIKE